MTKQTARRLYRAISLALAIALTIPLTALADSQQVDADTTTSGNQNSISLSAAQGATANTSGYIVISYAGSSHLAAGNTITFTVNPSQTTLPSGYSVGSTTVTIPSPWGPGKSVQSSAIPISFTAPSTGGSSSYAVKWDPSGPACITANPTCLSGSSAETINLTVTGDVTPPTSTASVSPAPNANGWDTSATTVTLSATDNTGGSGVASITYSATGAQPIASTTVAGGSTSVTISAEGTTTLSYFATDNAGNVESSHSLNVKIDLTDPSITASRSPAANGNGWNNTDVVVSFTCSDTPSGIASCPGPTTLSSNGAGQSASGAATDVAGRTASAGVSTINIDKAPPSISGVATVGGAPYGGAWTNQAVAVTFTCSDALSDLASCVGSATLASEGASQWVTGTATDKAGNTATATVSNVNIDKSAPTTVANAPANWTNTSVTVTLSATDSLSGVKATHFSLNGGAAQTGASVLVSGQGIHTLSYWSDDNAGNVEAAHSTTIKIDLTDPIVTHTLSPAANAALWNSGPVTVSFTCVDPDFSPTVPGSGIKTCSGPTTLSTEGRGQTATGGGVDNAGNSGTDTATVNIDITRPTITGSRSPAANANGWNNGDVAVTFSCLDNLSGLAGCGPDTRASAEGANQSVSGTATDAAGNSASATVSGISIDKTPPTLTGAASPAPNTNGWNNADVTVTWSCSDALSGIDSPSGLCPAPTAVAGEGDSLSASTTARDKAGNETSRTVSSIKIDRHSPSTTASLAGPLSNGWYTGAVTVTLSAADGLSGVATTSYSVDGGSAQTYSGAFSFSLGGVHSLNFWSTDKADNVEDKTNAANTLTIQVDNLPPSVNCSAPATGVWYTADVSVPCAASDTESGLVSAGDASFSLSTSGEGSALFTPARTVSDLAGNATTAGPFGPYMVDKTAPSVSSSATTADGAYSGAWTNQAVTVTFSCTDDGSGVASVTKPTTVSSQGANQLVDGTCTDRAGLSSSATFSGINIDTTPPAALINAPQRGVIYGPFSPAGFDFTCTDDLSGLASCSAQLNTGASVASGASIDTLAEGSYTLTLSARDAAGNAGSSSVDFKVDRSPPTISHAIDGTLGNNSWYTSNVTVAWTSGDSDNDILRTTGCGAQTVTADTAGTTLHCTVESVGGAASDDVAIKRDGAAPIITASATAGGKAYTPGAWTNQAVAVTFACTDATSGVASVTAPSTVGTEGSGQSATGTCSDNAGNVATTAFGPINIDLTAPVITKTATGAYLVPDGGTYLVTVSATDALSGLATCTYTVNSGSPRACGSFTLGAGTWTVAVTAADVAGNTAEVDPPITVEAVVGPFAPLVKNGAGVGQFKLGSTIPVKFQLKNGSLVTTATGTVCFGTTTTCAPFRWDSTAQQYIANLQSKGLAAGTYQLFLSVDGTGNSPFSIASVQLR